MGSPFPRSLSSHSFSSESALSREDVSSLLLTLADRGAFAGDLSDLSEAARLPTAHSILRAAVNLLGVDDDKSIGISTSSQISI